MENKKNDHQNEIIKDVNDDGIIIETFKKVKMFKGKQKSKLVSLCICPVCGLSSENRNTVKTHKDNHHSKSNRLKCDKCAKMFVTLSELTNHKERDHMKRREKAKINCVNCEVKFDDQVQFLIHMESHNTSGRNGEQ